MILIKVYMFVSFLFVSKAQKKLYMPNLPLGEYRIVINAVYQCEQSKNLPIGVNIYLSKKSSTATEIKGNITFKKPFEDSLIFDANFASWSLTGGWKPNNLVYVTSNGCTKLKNVLGNAWFLIHKAFNVSTANCPIPTGTYVTSGMDTSVFNDNNFPKVYFYGKYKYVGKLRNKENQQLACIAVELEIVRPWEIPKK